MTEEWRAVVGYEGRYEISDMGEVRSLLRSGRLLKQATHPESKHRTVLLSGYDQSGKSKQTTYYVQSLVLVAFVGSRPDGKQARHIDRNCSNNALANLRWDEPVTNHAHRKRMAGDEVPRFFEESKLTTEEAREIKSLLKEGKTQKAIANLYGVSRNAISDIATEKTWRSA